MDTTPGSRSRLEEKGPPGTGGPRREPVVAGPLEWLITPLLARFPRLRRQLHPLLVHFPITFMLSATFFSLLYLLTRVASFQTTAFHCLGSGLLFLLAAIWSGLLTERINFPEPPPSAGIEKVLSALLFAVGLAAFIWGLVNPDILDDLQGLNFIYLFLIIALTPLVTAIGYFGGMLTFPLENGGQPHTAALHNREPGP